ncbi:MAG: hypothetical protein WC797_01310 [Candidatus Paceibacterota bacterium]|jgi:hypothetical protein
MDQNNIQNTPADTGNTETGNVTQPSVPFTQPTKESLDERRRKAALAMGGNKVAEIEKKKEEPKKESWLSSITKSFTSATNSIDLAKRRAEAKMAMEGKSRREKRVEEERIEQLQTKQKKEQAEKERQLVAAKTRAEEERIAHAEAEKQAAAKQATHTRLEFEQIKKAGGNLNAIRTLRTDVDSFIKDQNMSAIKMAVMETERQKNGGANLEAPKPISKSAVAFIVVFLVAGLAIVFSAMWYKNISLTDLLDILKGQDKNAIVAPASPGKTEPNLVFVEEMRSLELGVMSPKEAASAVRTEIKNADLKLGAAEAIVLKQDGNLMPNLTAYLEKINLVLPKVLLRLLDQNLFMYGVYSSIENSGFLLLKTNFMEKAYAEMLSWEENLLAKDMMPFLSTKKGSDEIYKAKFKDELIKNTNARVLQSATGGVYLVYGFLDRDVLLITGTKQAFTEILRRYNTPMPQSK